MSVIYILLPLTVLLAAVAVWGFITAARSGQLDDLETPAIRMLHDDDEVEADEVDNPLPDADDKTG